MAKRKKTKARPKVRKPIKRKAVKKRKFLVKRKKTVKIKKIKSVKKRKKVLIAKKKPAFAKKAPARRRKIKKIAKKAPVKIVETEFTAETLFKARIKVIGIGGGGGSIVSEIGRSLEKATFVVCDTDIRALKKRSGIKYLWFGEEFTHGLGTGVNVDLARQAAESAKEKISELFKDQDIVIFIASLGGGLGSGATQVFAEAAREFGGITFGIFTLPFKFEGKNKYRIAQNALKSLRQSLNVSLVLPNEKIFKVIDANTPITQAFSVVNKSLIESLESLIDLIYNPGIINIDFADLRTILRGRGNAAFLNTVEESGKNRVEKVCEKILSNPLLQNSGFTAEKILFNIAGSENLSMFEVEKISSHISSQNPKSKIIFGISKNAKLKNKIKTTILMTGGEINGQTFEKPEPVKQEIKEKPPVAVKVVEKKQKPEIKPEIKPKKSIKPKKVKKPKKVEENIPAPEPIRQKPVSFAPVFENRIPAAPALDQKRMSIVEISADSGKKTIRRSALDIKKAEELQEKKKIAQEKEWEIPAFLRRVKYNK